MQRHCPDLSGLSPHDQREVGRFVYYLREVKAVKESGNPDGLTYSQLYDEMYEDDANPPHGGEERTAK